MRKRWLNLLLVLTLAPLASVPGRASGPESAPDHLGLNGDGAKAGPAAVRFGAVDVYVDSGDAPLAAYQFEVAARTGQVTVISLEGGEHAAFKEPPYYDPHALIRNRLIVAAFSTNNDLPHGKTRVARLMVQITGPAEPAYAAKLQVAASVDGKPIAAEISLLPATTQSPASEGSAP